MDAYIGFLNSGGLRGGFERGQITHADILGVLPFQNNIDLITIKGSDLRQTLLDSASRLSEDGKQTSGGFLQVSGKLSCTLIFEVDNLVLYLGIQFTIDLSRPKNDRIIELKVNTGSGYEDIVDEKVYKVVTTNYVANKGGDGYKVPQYKLSQMDGMPYRLIKTV